MAARKKVAPAPTGPVFAPWTVIQNKKDQEIFTRIVGSDSTFRQHPWVNRLGAFYSDAEVTRGGYDVLYDGVV